MPLVSIYYEKVHCFVNTMRLSFRNEQSNKMEFIVRGAHHDGSNP
jgi:hypothetical protein